MKNNGKMIAALTALTGLGMQAYAQEFSFSAGAEYTSGDYGGSSDTDVLYMPFSVGVDTDNWYARATLPYLDISGPGTFLGDNIPLVRDTALPSRTGDQSVSGFGDLSLTVGRSMILDEAGLWHLDVSGRVKFATADSDEGIGTGEMDYSVALDLTRDVGAWSWFGGGGYRMNGDPADFNLDNTIFASLGGARYDENGGSWGFAYDFSQAATAGTDDAHELSSWLAFRLSDNVRMQVYGLTGLSDGGPDYGGGLRLTFQR